jgi:hypothetical protein
MHKLFLFLLSSLIMAGCVIQQPQIKLETAMLDLGDVVNGEIISRDLIVYNEGEAPLIIEAVSTSCGCTKATLDPMTIPAGGSGILHLEFDSGAHGPELTGELMRHVFIASNDPQHPEVVLEFTANILAKSGP